jgi:hypothetical protein
LSTICVTTSVSVPITAASPPTSTIPAASDGGNFALSRRNRTSGESSADSSSAIAIGMTTCDSRPIM